MEDEVKNGYRRVCIISSASIQTKSLAELMKERTGIDCVVRSELRRAASTMSVGNHPSLILVDSLFIPPKVALQQLEQLPAPLTANVMIAMINMPKDDQFEIRSIALGVKGLFYSSTDLDSLVRGIETMFEGDVWIPRKLLASALYNGEKNHFRRSPKVSELLTRRERQILAMISIGSSNDEIADRLSISTNTVRTHVYNLFRKINVPNRMQAALWGADNL